MTFFARTENRSRFSYISLIYIILLCNIPVLKTFNLLKNQAAMLPRTAFSVVFFCKKTKVTKKGKAPIYARITQLTANKYHRLLRYMTEYIRDTYHKEDLPLETVDYAYVDGLNTYMQTAYNCHNNGAVNLLCCLKNFLLYAVRNEWIEKNPFRSTR